MQDAVAYIALCGTALGVCARLPALAAARDGRGSGRRATSLHAAASACALVYASAHEVWPVMLDRAAALALDGALLALDARRGEMKKSSSGTDLTLLDS